MGRQGALHSKRASPWVEFISPYPSATCLVVPIPPLVVPRVHVWHPAHSTRLSSSVHPSSRGPGWGLSSPQCSLSPNTAPTGCSNDF